MNAQKVFHLINEELLKRYLIVDLTRMWMVKSAIVTDSEPSLFCLEAIRYGYISGDEGKSMQTFPRDNFFCFEAMCDKKTVIGMMSFDPNCAFHVSFCKLIIHDMEEIQIAKARTHS